MTNGEKIQEVFETYVREVGEGMTRFYIDGIMYLTNTSWWNSEYKEPITKNDLALDCVSREQALRELKESAEHHANNSREEVLLRRDRDIIRGLPSVTPQEPTLDKIREEIEQLRLHKAQFLTNDNKVCIDSQEVLNILDKYKAESEGEKCR